MAIIKNVHPVTAETLFHILKSEFTNEINLKLNSNLTIDYAHVYDVINVSFPEIIEGTAFTITINENDIEMSNNGGNTDYHTDLLEEHLYNFLLEKCS